MATPMTADQFLAALKAEGVKVTEHAGWRDHNRNGHGGWGPMNGVMIHHTAGTAPSDGALVYGGRSDLPGPLAHGYLAKGGVVTMTANGRANHAGGGDPGVLAAVAAEGFLPATHFHEGSSGAADGNAHFYGLEISNLGTSGDPYPLEQYKAAVRWAAAICRHHGWSSSSVIGHKEWSDWKNDPSFDIRLFRIDVATCLRSAPGVWPAPAKTTTTPPKEATVPESVWDHTETNKATGKPVRMGTVLAWLDYERGQDRTAILAAIADLKAEVAALKKD